MWLALDGLVMSGMNASESSRQFGADHVVVMARLSDVDAQKEIAQPCIGKCAAVHRELSRFCKVGLALESGDAAPVVRCLGRSLWRGTRPGRRDDDRVPGREE